MTTFILTLITIISIGQTKEYYDQITDSFVRIGQSDKLIPYFQTELKAKPGNEIVLRSLGYLYIQDSNLDLGERYYREALDVNPNCARCYLNLGRIYVMRKELNKASELFDQAIKMDSNDAALFSARARLKEIKGEKFSALIDLKRAIALDPINSEYYVQRGKYYSNQGNFSQALVNLDKAVELAPNHFAPYYEKSNLYYGRHMFDEAIDNINKAIQLDSNQYQLFNGRGAIYSELKEYDKAISDYSRAIILNPKDYLPYYNRAMDKYALEDMDGSCTDIHACHAVLLNYDSTNLLRSDLEYSMGNYCDSSKASYYYQRGIAFYNLQKFGQAVDVYTRGLKLFPKNAMLLSFRGNAYFSLDDHPNALTDYYASIKNRENVINDIEANKRHTGLSEESVRIYLSGFVAGMQISIAESKFALGQYDEALIEINKGIDVPPDMKEIGKEIYYNVRGNIYLALGKYQLALNDFDKCIQIKPAYSLAYVNRAVAKINLANKIQITAYSIRVGGNFQTFNANWTMPLKTTVKKSDANVLSALADCNIAIEIEPNLDFGYYMRGRIKKMLFYGDYCFDLLKANELGYPVELGLINGCLR